MTGLSSSYALPPGALLADDAVELRLVRALRAVERAGFTLVDEVATLPEGVGPGLGQRVCRYALEDVRRPA